MTGTPSIEPTVDPAILERLNAKVAHPARVYDALLGGKDNFAADRETADALLQASPRTVEAMRANRAFLDRAVTYLTAEEGISQFLDIGTGLPTVNNTHEVAQRNAPESRVVYVDNDPMVLLHAQTMLTSTKEGKTSYIDADLREPAKIFSQAAGTLDFSQPTAVILLAILHFIPDADDPYRIVQTLVDALAPGSYLVISHVADDTTPEIGEIARRYNERVSSNGFPRSRAEGAGFFSGLDLVPPGLVPLPKWRPRSEPEAAAYPLGWAGVGKKSRLHQTQLGPGVPRR
jgi:SAM-dependent methyltransferase